MSRLVPFEDSDKFDVPQYDPEDYRDGGEGMILWCDNHVWIPIYPEGSDVAGDAYLTNHAQTESRRPD